MYAEFKPTPLDGQAPPLLPEDFEALDDILDEMRTRLDETPQWEFCEGFLAALVCGRRALQAEEYLPVLLGLPLEGEVQAEGQGSFRDEAQRRRFAELWRRRWAEVQAALEAQVQTLDDERCYHPELLDARGAVLALEEAERAAIAIDELPAFGQVWALGFMFAVESWPEEWAAPRDKALAERLDGALGAMVGLTEEDSGPPEVSPFDEGPPTVSHERVNALADAIWAVYDLHALWRELGPRIATVRAAATPGRNDPCACGSGKKYKKCCGA